MTEDFCKLASGIILSTIWREDDHTRILWITLLALKGRDHRVLAAIPGLAAVANIPVESCRAGLAKLMAPDPDSRTKEHEGRRIAEVPGGWMVLNGEKYRNFMSRQERNEYQAKLMAERRRVAKLAPVSKKLAPLAQAEAEAEAEISQPQASISVASLPKYRVFRKPTLDEVKFACEKAGLPITEGARFWDYYESNGWRVGKNPMRSWPSALANWKRNFDTQRYANSQTARRSNPRNDGIAIGPTDYGEAAKRKLERQALEARNREASEAQGT